MGSRVTAPRFGAIYVRQGKASWVQHELRQLIAGLGPPLLYAVDDDRDGEYGVVLTDSDVDAFWNTQPDCRMPNFPYANPKRPLESFFARLWPPNYITWLGAMISTQRTRREVAEDLINFPGQILNYVRSQWSDANNEPLQVVSMKGYRE